MKLSLRIILIICFLHLFISLKANNIHITKDYDIKVNYDSTAFLNFIENIEKGHSIKFYYNKSWLNKVMVKQTHIPTNLSQVLYDSFKGTELNYLIDGSNIIITNNYKINTTLPENFFSIESLVVKNSSDSIDLKYSFFHEEKARETNLKEMIVYIGNSTNIPKGNKVVLSGIVRNEENGSDDLHG